MKKALVFGVLLLSLLLAVAGCSTSSGTNQEINALGDTDTSTEMAGLEKFTATDLNGQQVTQEVFAKYDVTMINIWGTYCSYCLQEMPGLGELAQEYKDKNVQIIGIVIDVLEPNGEISAEQVNLAQTIVKQTGANYQHLLPSKDLILAKLQYVTGIPETFFVDKKGNIIGNSYYEAKSKAQWAKIIDTMLKEVK